MTPGLLSFTLGNMRLSACLLGLFVCCIAPAQTVAPTLAFGDSLTDEYATNGFAYSKNWFEQLRDLRRMPAGPWGNYAEPRNQGNSRNYARFGATSGMVADWILANDARLRAQVLLGNIRYGIVMVGSNDFGDPALLNDIYNGMTPQQYEPMMTSLYVSAFAIVARLKSMNLKVVLCGIPDPVNSPQIRLATPDKGKAELISIAIAQANSKLDLAAQVHKVPFVDSFGLSREILGTASVPKTTLAMGGNTILPLQAGLGGLNGFVHDGLHPHSVIQSLLANCILDAMHRRYGAPNFPLTEREMCQVAGLPYTRNELTLFYSRFTRIYR